ncbi:MAG: class I SAM-dependent methyltransferase [Desulfurococcales archaeon]|nr:class I SAM-dependent methyltransferase [Desulfurococcales archaeon]
MFPSRDMERFYKVYPWSEDPESAKRRIEHGVDLFRKAVEHEWLSHLVKRRRVKILDLMGGTGIGAIALALALKETGVESDITIADLRESALRIAEEYAKEYLGITVETVVAPAEDFAGTLACPKDIILIHGYSLPHLDPYRFVRMSANMAACLNYDGVVMIQELDRVYNIFYLIGYKDVLVEKATEDHLVVSYHSGYDYRLGMFKRLIVNQDTGERIIGLMRFWDIAGLAGILWSFFEDVDFLPFDRPGVGFLMATRPRKMRPEEYSVMPRIVSNVDPS